MRLRTAPLLTTSPTGYSLLATQSTRPPVNVLPNVPSSANANDLAIQGRRRLVENKSVPGGSLSNQKNHLCRYCYLICRRTSGTSWKGVNIMDLAKIQAVDEEELRRARQSTPQGEYH